VSDDLKAADLTPESPETLLVILQESDRRISAQVQVMLATDSRSNTLLSASTALAAGAFGVAASQYPTGGFSPLVVGAAAFATAATVGAFAAMWALWPEAIQLQGWSPRYLAPDVTEKKAHQVILAEMTVFNQEKISHNDRCNTKISNRGRLAILALASAPLVGAAAAFIAAVI
jgi:hypothetical protein